MGFSQRIGMILAALALAMIMGAAIHIVPGLLARLLHGNPPATAITATFAYDPTVAQDVGANSGVNLLGVQERAPSIASADPLTVSPVSAEATP